MNFKFRLDFSSAVTTVANFELCLFFLLGSGCEDFEYSHVCFQAWGIFVYRRVHFGFLNLCYVFRVS